MKRHLLILGVALMVNQTPAAGLPIVPLTDAWKAQIEALAPEKATVVPQAKRRVLLYSEATGFQHWVIPHTKAVLQILADKTGVCEIVPCADLAMFTPERLKTFDAVILNNNCSKNPDRHLFLDILGDREKAEALENNLIDYVKGGGGLLALHGAIVIFNNSDAFSDVLGGSFETHPPQQELTLTPADPEHPLVRAFGGKDFVHVDEPYLFNRAYAKKNFRPLLLMVTSDMKNEKVRSEVRYVSWIKSHGKGRVMYISPSHNAQSFEQAALLRYYLDGLQYVLGDLKCDDAPLTKKD